MCDFPMMVIKTWASIPAFQASAASGSEDFSTQEAKAMQTKHISDCLSLEKRPTCPEGSTRILA